MSHYLDTRPVFSIARVVLETTVPLAVSSGRTNHVFDNDLVRDASGLPMIPGTALAGLLRHLYWREYGQREMENIFGMQDRDVGAASLLEVSAGVIHDSRNRPVAPHYAGGDPLLDFARETRQTPVYRDRVAINKRGAAKDTGFFDRTVLPAGFRFSVELVLHSARAEERNFSRLLALLAHPMFRLGASTRAGLGACHVVQVATAQLDLKDPAQAARFLTIERSISSVAGLQTAGNISGAAQAMAATISALPSFAVLISPIAAWRIGQGEISLRGSSDKVPDLLPRVEQRVRWHDGVGAMSKDEILVPASSIKGALRHRAYFYACCEAGYFADPDGPSLAQSREEEQADAAINAVFGDASDNADGVASGSVGNLVINDLYLPINAKTIGKQMHNAIDRFSGGVRNRMLFSEELLFDSGLPLKIEIWLDEKNMGIDEAALRGKRAALRAIEDLTEGRLGLGGGTSKGHGLFKGKLVTIPMTSNSSESQHAN